jgi:uncharacterized protein YndB with AHSA1/START domain
VDLYARLASPVETVFGLLADPARLSDWLQEVMRTPAGLESAPGVGDAFPLAMRLDGVGVAGSGEMIAFEPPWLVGYRLFAGARTFGLRVTCTAHAGGARIRVHQPDGAPLTVDLARLEVVLAGSLASNSPASL